MRYAIIVAGGKGSRFGSDKPKQFLPLAGKPVLMHTIDRFATLQGVTIIVVLPSQFIGWWRELCVQHNYTTPHTIVEGGNTRFSSVKNAITTISPETGDVIAVHDGVRPLASAHLIEEIFIQAEKQDSAIPVVAPTDSIRQITDNKGNSQPLDRALLRAVQTPQAFSARQLKAAYATEFQPFYTDDASVYEHNGGTIHLIDGEPTNIKITHPNDLVIAELLMK